MIIEWEPMEVGSEAEAMPEEVQPGQPWKETVTGMTFAWIPPGCFKMGSAPRSEGRDDDEGPVHEVCLSGFWIGRQEVTQGQWRQVMRSNPSHYRLGAEYPVERVSWEDVEGLVRKLNARYPGRYRFRLPTEAEWEYACRDGGKREVYAGGNAPQGVGWFRENSSGTTQPVGRQRANRLGLFDQSGNVWEWVLDGYQSAAYTAATVNDPVVGESSSFRVIRGGGFQSEARSLRCANRGVERFSVRRADVGFRLVRVIEAGAIKKHGLQDLRNF